PHVEEINLTDGVQVTKQESDLKIAPVETDSKEQACDEDHQEFEILEQSNDSIVSEPNDRTNTSINQKEPAVDCFSCTISFPFLFYFIIVALFYDFDKN
ncbi:hypothetical protein BpHYR1_048401, partial [Brachionus plicatilis]